MKFDGVLDPRWRVEADALDDVHVAASCRGPVTEAVDLIGIFRLGLLQLAAGVKDTPAWRAVLQAPRPGFLEITPQQLLPDDKRAGYQQVCVRARDDARRKRRGGVEYRTG